MPQRQSAHSGTIHISIGVPTHPHLTTHPSRITEYPNQLAPQPSACAARSPAVQGLLLKSAGAEAATPLHPHPFASQHLLVRHKFTEIALRPLVTMQRVFSAKPTVGGASPAALACSTASPARTASLRSLMAATLCWLLPFAAPPFSFEARSGRSAAAEVQASATQVALASASCTRQQTQFGTSQKR